MQRKIFGGRVRSGMLYCAMLLFAVWAAALLSAEPYAAFAADSFLINETQAAVFTEGPVDLPYRLRLPDGYDAGGEYHLVLFLHGAGECGSDNIAPLQAGYGFAESIARSGRYKKDTILLIPQCPAGYRWVEQSWSSGAYTMEARLSPALEAVKNLLDATVNKYAVDPARVYVCGVSMGGMGVWDLIARYPGYFAAAAAICGCLDESKADLYAQTPVFTAHDLGDTVVGALPTAHMAQTLQNTGADIVYKTYDIGARDSSRHSVWLDVFVDTDSAGNVYETLFSHARQTYEVCWQNKGETVGSRFYAAGMQVRVPKTDGVRAWRIGEQNYLPGEAFTMPAAAVRAEAVQGSNAGLLAGCCAGGAALLAAGIAAGVALRKRARRASSQKEKQVLKNSGFGRICQYLRGARPQMSGKGKSRLV